MGATNNGGPAFPSICESVNGVPLAKGLTVRDYFAAHADVSVYAPLEAFERARGRRPTIGELAAYIAEIRVLEAEAMLDAYKVPVPEAGWIEWEGGDCPVAKGSLVDVRLRMGNEYFRQRAGVHEDKPLGYAEDWSHARRQHPGDIVAYRIVTP